MDAVRFVGIEGPKHGGDGHVQRQFIGCGSLDRRDDSRPLGQVDQGCDVGQAVPEGRQVVDMDDRVRVQRPLAAGFDGLDLVTPAERTHRPWVVMFSAAGSAGGDQQSSLARGVPVRGAGCVDSWTVSAGHVHRPSPSSPHRTRIASLSVRPWCPFLPAFAEGDAKTAGPVTVRSRDATALVLGTDVPARGARPTARGPSWRAAQSRGQCHGPSMPLHR